MRRNLTTLVVIDAGVLAVGVALFFAYHLTGPVVASITALTLAWGFRFNRIGIEALSFIVFESLVVMWQLSQASQACWLFASFCLAMGFPGAVASLVLNVLVGLPFLAGIALLDAHVLTKKRWSAAVDLRGLPR